MPEYAPNNTVVQPDSRYATKQGLYGLLEQLEGTDSEAKRNEEYIPEGYDSAEQFLEEARDLYKADYEADRENMEAALDDLEFIAGEQWDDQARQVREDLGQPCMTINTLPQFIGQVVGDRLVNQTAIKVLPNEDGDTDIAEVRGDLIRSIEVQSHAQTVYNKAFEHAVSCGRGNFRIELDSSIDEPFDYSIFLRAIDNPLAVLWDYMAIDPTGRDAGHCFVEDLIPDEVFNRRWPNQEPTRTTMGYNTYSSCRLGGWIENNTVRVCEYWRIIERERIVAQMRDGSTLDITDMDPEQTVVGLFFDEQGQPRVRRVKRKFAQMHVITGYAILEGPFELPIDRVPIIRCDGRIVNIGNKRARFGLVRYAKDPQRLKNFWRSVAAEYLAKAPRNQWFGPSDAFEGRENDFRDAATSGDPIIRYNKNASRPPEQVRPPEIPQAILQEAQLNSQDMKDVTGIHDASLGIRSNETSGVAIMRRQQEGDIGTSMYHTNMNWSQQAAGDVINQLIPFVYDRARTLRLTGEDGVAYLKRTNDPMDPKAVDLTKGRYDITVSTGPSYMTRRIEAADSMIQFAQAAPGLLPRFADLLAKAQDWPGADEIAERLKPPDVEDDDIPPAIKQQLQQMGQVIQALQAANQKLQDDREIEVEKVKIDAYDKETNRLKAVTAKDFPLSPQAVEMLQPLVQQMVLQVLASPDVLPPDQPAPMAAPGALPAPAATPGAGSPNPAAPPQPGQ